MILQLNAKSPIFSLNQSPDVAQNRRADGLPSQSRNAPERFFQSPNFAPNSTAQQQHLTSMQHKLDLKSSNSNFQPNQTSYMTHSNVNGLNSNTDISSIYLTNLSQQQNHLQSLQMDKVKFKHGKSMGSSNDEAVSPTMRSMNDSSKPNSQRPNNQAQPNKEILVIDNSSTDLSNQKMVHLVKMYENEIEQLRNSNSEQTQDLHTLIQTVSDLKREQKGLLDKLQAKDEMLHSFQQEHDHEIKRIQSQNQEELLK